MNEKLNCQICHTGEGVKKVRNAENEENILCPSCIEILCLLAKAREGGVDIFSLLSEVLT
jgi:hypothetical protein